MKPFDAELNALYDPLAKGSFVQFLSECDYRNIQVNNESPAANKDHIYWDVSGTDPDFTKHVYDVEIKTQWKGIKYPFFDIRIPARKQRTVADVFIVFNNTATAFWYIPIDVFLQSAIITLSVRNWNNDTFRSINKSRNDIYFYAKEDNYHWQELSLNG